MLATNSRFDSWIGPEVRSCRARRTRGCRGGTRVRSAQAASPWRARSLEQALLQRHGIPNAGRGVSRRDEARAFVRRAGALGWSRRTGWRRQGGSSRVTSPSTLEGTSAHAHREFGDAGNEVVWSSERLGRRSAITSC